MELVWEDRRYVLIYPGNVYRCWLGERESRDWEEESKIESESLELDIEDLCDAEIGNNQTDGNTTYNFNYTI